MPGPSLFTHAPAHGSPQAGGRFLLDANTLVALADRQHVQHRAVRRWFEREVHLRGWATCPSVERVALAVMAHPEYPGCLPLRDAGAVLMQQRCCPGHVFWAEEIDLLSAREPVLWQAVPAPGALADLALLALAARHGGVLVTLGRRVPFEGLRGPCLKQHWLRLEALLATANSVAADAHPMVGAGGARLPATRA